MEKTQQCQETLPSHISKIGLCTGHMYFIGAIVAYLNNFPNLIVVCSCVYVTTMVHWHNMTDFAYVEIPYAFKLLAQELQTINCVPRLMTE